jgi:hypothetical protein
MSKKELTISGRVLAKEDYDADEPTAHIEMVDKATHVLETQQEIVGEIEESQIGLAHVWWTLQGAA